MKKFSTKIVHFCAVSSVGLAILIAYSLLVDLDTHTTKLGGLLVFLIAWGLEQWNTNCKRLDE